MAVENALDVDDVAVVEQPRPISGTIFPVPPNSRYSK